MADKYYTFEDTRAKKSKTAVTVLTVAVVVLLLVAVGIASWYLGKKYAADKAENTTEATTEAVSTTEAPSPYEVGAYRINVGEGYTGIKLREEPNTDSSSILEIPNGQIITVTEVFENTGAVSAEVLYWGKTTYLGRVGWIALFYTEKDLGDSIVTSITETTEAETTEPLTPIKEYVPGEYIVNADGSLRLRATADVESDTVASIPQGTRISVTEVYENTAQPQTAYRYWGKVVYGEYTGWVAMYYLAELPEETTVPEEPSATEAEPTTAQ